MNSLLYLIIRSIFIDYLFIFIFMYLIGLKHIVYFISELNDMGVSSFGTFCHISVNHLK